MRRLAVPLAAAAAVVALALPSASSPATIDTFPVFNVGSDAHLLDETADLTFDAYDLDSAADSEKVTVQTPSGYGVFLTHPVGDQLGEAGLVMLAGATQKAKNYTGDLVVMDAAGYAADTGAQSCDPGTHTAYWELKALVASSGSEIDIPIAVDRNSKGLRLTMCFDAEHALHLELSEIYFTMENVFRNPSHNGKYLFDVVVTPFASDGTGDASSAYELRGWEYLPQLLSATTTFDPATKTLTVTGTLGADGKPRAGINVHIWAGASSDVDTMKEIGVAVTKGNGSYVFTRRFATPPKWEISYVHHYQYETCAGRSFAPGGCASYTIDGRDTFPERVTAPTP